jgi:TetR/AcrR family transcriptional regulator, ethionamide resistance regulator
MTAAATQSLIAAGYGEAGAGRQRGDRPDTQKQPDCHAVPARDAGGSGPVLGVHGALLSYCRTGINERDYTATVAVKSPETRPARRRRTPQDARQEILDAARQLIAERPMHEVTVLAIMEKTTLTRKSFYVYFRDRSELIIALVRPLRAQADAALAHWAGAADPVHAGRAALRAAASLYRQHGTIMRALFWASAEDPDLAAARRDLTEPVIDTALGVIGPIAADPDPQRLRATVRALVTMNVHSMLALPADAADADLDQLVDTLAAIWERATLPAATGAPSGPPQGA